MNNFKLPEDVYRGLLEYLVTKPYAEVYQLLPHLENLEQVDIVEELTAVSEEIAEGLTAAEDALFKEAVDE